jgi:hypothetical protein
VIALRPHYIWIDDISWQRSPPAVSMLSAGERVITALIASTLAWTLVMGFVVIDIIDPENDQKKPVLVPVRTDEK